VVFVHDDHGAGAVGPLERGARGDRALGVEGGGQPCQPLGGGAGPYALVPVEGVLQRRTAIPEAASCAAQQVGREGERASWLIGLAPASAMW
jgi:hypothetical protein